MNAVAVWKKSITPGVEKQVLSINGVDTELGPDVETFTIPVVEGSYAFELWAVRAGLASTKVFATLNVPAVAPEAPTDFVVVLE